MSYGKNRIKIYDPKFGGFNPYPALLKDAKFVISTCDSISMCSEVASLAKPFYLYIPKNFTSSKHLTFAYQLQDLGISKVLQEQEEILQEYQYINLNECRKAADYVLATILSAK